MIKLTRPPCPNPTALTRNDYKHPQNKDALRIASHDKCMYCESKVSHIDFAHVEHIKPKSDENFPELAFEWTNLGYACAKCNNSKSDKYYPDAVFIDPYSEHPERHIFAFGAVLYAKNGCERGDITIREIDLNRTALIEKRTKRISDVQSALNACFRSRSEQLRTLALQELLLECEADKEFSACVKALFVASGVAGT